MQGGPALPRFGALAADHAATHHTLSIVDDRRLSRRNRQLRLVEVHVKAISGGEHLGARRWCGLASVPGQGAHCERTARPRDRRRSQRSVWRPAGAMLLSCPW